MADSSGEPLVPRLYQRVALARATGLPMRMTRDEHWTLYGWSQGFGSWPRNESAFDGWPVTLRPLIASE